MLAYARFVILGFAMLGAAACEKDNLQGPDGGGGGSACKADGDCATVAGKNVCDTGNTNVCVQCTLAKASACTGTTPVCTTDNACHGCTKHSDCPGSDTCLPDGSCAAETAVAYVLENGTGSECTRLAPCGTLAAAVNKVSGTRPTIKMTGNISSNSTTTIEGKVVTIIGALGASLSRTGKGTLVEVKNANTNVKIYDLEFKDTDGNAIEMTGADPALELARVRVSKSKELGILASAGSLKVSRSSIVDNEGGGVQVQGTNTSYLVSGNIIVHNGKARGAGASAVGGVALVSNTTGSRLEWNTIAFNESNGGTFRGGASCNGSMATATGNVYFHNSEDGGGGNLKTDATTQTNTVGGCAATNNRSVPTDDAANLGFKSVVAPYDFRLNSSSPLVDTAGATCPSLDIEAQTRPAGAACDYGADEYLP